MPRGGKEVRALLCEEPWRGKHRQQRQRGDGSKGDERSGGRDAQLMAHEQRDRDSRERVVGAAQRRAPRAERPHRPLLPLSESLRLAAFIAERQRSKRLVSPQHPIALGASHHKL